MTEHKRSRRASLRGLLQELREDYERHADTASHLSMLAVANYKFGQWADQQPWLVRKVANKFYGAGLFLAEGMTGIFLDRGTEIGDDIHFVHAGSINIHPNAKLGDRVGIMHGVTIGTATNDEEAPTIGDDVFIGANASVLGGIEIGDQARIAANSLVVNSVPPGALAIGVPARIVPVNPAMDELKRRREEAAKAEAAKAEAKAAAAQKVEVDEAEPAPAADTKRGVTS